MLTGHETVMGPARPLARVYDVADRIWGAASAVRSVPVDGVRVLDGIQTDDVIDAVRSRLLSPCDVDALASPAVLADPVRSTHVVLLARSVLQDAEARDAVRHAGGTSREHAAAGVRALVTTLGGDALEAALARDATLRETCLRFGSLARCRIAVSAALDAVASSDPVNLDAHANEAVAQIASEPNAPGEAGAVIVSALRSREAVGAIAASVAHLAQATRVRRPIPSALEGMLLAALRHPALNPMTARAHPRPFDATAFNAVRCHALAATSELGVLERAIRSDVTPLPAEHYPLAVDAALRVHAALTARGRVTGRTLVADATLFDVAHDVVGNQASAVTGAPEGAYRGAVGRLAGAAIATAALYRNAPGGEPLVRAAGAFMEVVAARQPSLASAVSERWRLVQHNVAVAVAPYSPARVTDIGEGVEPAIVPPLPNTAPALIDAEAKRMAVLRGLPVEQDEVSATAFVQQ